MTAPPRIVSAALIALMLTIPKLARLLELRDLFRAITSELDRPTVSCRTSRTL
jgi:hypothetical protein